MGGRGASSGVSDKGRAYGSEYTTLYKSGNIKFIKYNDTKSSKVPLETMIKGRVYAVINEKNEVASIAYYDTKNKKNRQIDLTHTHDGKKPHVHHGYIHDENGTAGSTAEERKMVDRANTIWYNKHNKQ